MTDPTFVQQVAESYYRGFWIRPACTASRQDLEYVHKDYDGPGDNRHGTLDGTLDDAYDAIDEFITEELWDLSGQERADREDEEFPRR